MTWLLFSDKKALVDDKHGPGKQGFRSNIIVEFVESARKKKYKQINMCLFS